MINIEVVLYTGNLKHGHFTECDSHEMIFDTTEYDPDTINNILNLSAMGDDAELWIVVNYQKKYLLGTFKRIKLKSKGDKVNYKWVVRE